MRWRKGRRDGDGPGGTIRFGPADDGVAAFAEGRHEHLRLRVDGVSALQQLAAAVAGRVAVRQLEVAVDLAPGTRVPQRFSIALEGVRRQQVDLRRGSVRVELMFGRDLDLGAVLRSIAVAVSPVLLGRVRVPEAVLLAVPTTGSAAPLIGAVDGLVAGDGSTGPVAPADVLVTHDTQLRSSSLAPVVVQVDDVVAHGAVDPAVHRPDRRSEQAALCGAGSFEDGGIAVRTGDQRRQWRGDLTDLDVAGLRDLASCEFPGTPPSSAQQRLLVQLSACGVVVRVPVVAPDGELSDLERLWQRAASAGRGPDERESVAQRRAAHRDHSLWRQLPRSGSSLSVLLCSNRPERLERALRGVRHFAVPDMELVLGLHGVGAPDHLDEWLEPVRAVARVQVVPISGSEPLGAALSVLTARSDGTLVTKIDDDDAYGRHHLWDLKLARDYSGAAVVGKGAEFVHLVGEDRTVRRGGIRPERSCRTVAGGTMLISRADLAAVGGWRPTSRSVDRALLDRVLHAGALVYRTHSFGYLYERRTDGHTWVAARDHFTANVIESRPGAWLTDDD